MDRNDINLLLDMAEKLQREKHSPNPLASVGPYLHGNGGLFATPGVDANVFSAIVRPVEGLASALPVLAPGSAATEDFGGYDSPLFTTITGVTEGDLDDLSNQPDSICGEAPIAGLLKACTLLAPFGRYAAKTRPLSVLNVGRLTNRGEPIDLRLLNPNNDNESPVSSPTLPMMGGSILTNELSARLYELGISFQRALARQTYNGNAAISLGDGYRQFNGLDVFINVGNKRDALTGMICTALDSDLKDFGFDFINGSGRDIVNYLDTLINQLSWNATQTGLDPVEWVIAMRPELFDELVKVWPIRYYLEGILQMNVLGGTGGVVNLTAEETTRMRDDMRNNRYLPIRGQRYRVVLDNTIPELNVNTANQLLAGQYASDIYVVPLTVIGGFPVTYWEARNQANAIAESLIEAARGAAASFVSDNGKFRWFVNAKNGCYDWQVWVEPRIIMRTPFLAGRILNVAYSPLQHYREWDPNSPYFVDGGRTNTDQTRYYTEWSETPVVVG